MRVLASGPDETKRAGFNLGRLLRPGSTVCLYGDLGAGKTTFIKGIAGALGIEEREIMSASFIIVSEHRAAALCEEGLCPPFYHIDLYRVDKESDLDEIGLYDYIGGGGIAAIEWAERIDIQDCVKVRISMLTGDRREIIIEGIDETDWDNRQGRAA